MNIISKAISFAHTKIEYKNTRNKVPVCENHYYSWDKLLLADSQTLPLSTCFPWRSHVSRSSICNHFPLIIAFTLYTVLCAFSGQQVASIVNTSIICCLCFDGIRSLYLETFLFLSRTGQQEDCRKVTSIIFNLFLKVI